MRLLVLSFYYHPDLGAGSFRATALVKALREQDDVDVHVDVVTTAPNRYRSYATSAPALETHSGLQIRRILLPGHSSDMRGQSRAFLTYARGALQFASTRQYDAVFATSSRLMTAALGAWIAKRRRAKLYLDIRDIFADTIPQMLSPPLVAPAARLFSSLESWTVRQANRVNIVSPGFAAYFRERYADVPLVEFTNGIDDEFLEAGLMAAARPPDGPARILYAGNIGEGQGLHDIVPELARTLGGRARFIIIGDGGRRRQLAERIAGVANVELLEPMPRAALLEAYAAADVLFLHLGDYPAFEKVLPSKVFEYGALGKPVLAGVAGYAAKFIETEIANAAVFKPCDAVAGAAAFARLKLAATPRDAFKEKFRRDAIMRSMATDILSSMGPSGGRG